MPHYLMSWPSYISLTLGESTFPQPRWKVLEHKFSISCELAAVLKDCFIRFLLRICYHHTL